MEIDLEKYLDVDQHDIISLSFSNRIKHDIVIEQEFQINT